MTDEELGMDARHGSGQAFEALFERYRGPVWQFFRRRVAEAAHAEELAQDTFVALLEGLNRFEARTTFRAYVFGIAYHVLSAYRRKAAHRSTDPLEFDPHPVHRRSGCFTPGASCADPTRRGRPRDPHAAVYHELSYQEIADFRRLPLNTVRSPAVPCADGAEGGTRSRGRFTEDETMNAVHPIAPEDVMAHLDGELPAGQARGIEAHLAGCDACRQLLSELRQGSAADERMAG